MGALQNQFRDFFGHAHHFKYSNATLVLQLIFWSVSFGTIELQLIWVEMFFFAKTFILRTKHLLDVGYDFWLWRVAFSKIWVEQPRHPLSGDQRHGRSQ